VKTCKAFLKDYRVSSLKAIEKRVLYVLPFRKDMLSCKKARLDGK